MNEQWRRIGGTYYEISDRGRVRSLDRWGDKPLYVPQASLPRLFDAHPDSIAVCLCGGSVYFR